MFPVKDSHLAAIGVQPELRSLYLEPLNAAMDEHSIRSGERPAMFVAQIAHESGRFRYTSELWGPTKQQLRYDDNGALARALGNAPGEGYAYRGHGLIQITGYYNHKAVAKHFGIDMRDIVEWLTSPPGACRSAAHFWLNHGCNELADRFDFVGITRRINGGLNGLADRTALYKTLTALK